MTAAGAGLALSVLLSACGDPTFDPEAPLRLGVRGSTALLAFCEAFEASRVHVEVRPIDNSEPWEVLFDAAGDLSLIGEQVLGLDTLPPDVTGTVGAAGTFQGVKVAVLVVASDDAVGNLRGEFSIPADGLSEGEWLDGRGQISTDLCAPES